MKRLTESSRDLMKVLDGVKAKQMAAFEEEILSCHRVFVTGLGRSLDMTASSVVEKYEK